MVPQGQPPSRSFFCRFSLIWTPAGYSHVRNHLFLLGNLLAAARDRTDPSVSWNEDRAEARSGETANRGMCEQMGV